MLQFSSFDDRFNYLKLNGSVGTSTFDEYRYYIQKFYNSMRWLKVRDSVILRDNGCEFGLEGYDIGRRDLIVIHHINPLTIDDLLNETEYLLNPEYLITVSQNTHLALHYSNRDMLLINPIIERFQNDTIPWK